MKIQYKVINSMCDNIEETLNTWAKEGWILVQIIYYPDDMGVSIVMEKN